jgi:hypothetical protein
MCHVDGPVPLVTFGRSHPLGRGVISDRRPFLVVKILYSWRALYSPKSFAVDLLIVCQCKYRARASDSDLAIAYVSTNRIVGVEVTLTRPQLPLDPSNIVELPLKTWLYDGE